MNEADPAPINLDELRLLPNWLREEGPPPSKQYASHEGATADDYGTRRGPRPGGSFNRDRPAGRGFGGGASSGGSSGGGGGDRRRDGGGNRRNGPPPRGGQGRPMRDERRPAPEAPAAPAPVRIEFLPDEKCLASITKQIRSTHLAYPLFGLARMFLQEPARHWVQFNVVPEAASAGASLFQMGEDGPVTLDRTVLERIAFDASKDRYYVEQTEQKEPLKGNFTNVARNRLSGALLGPTNYHGYQPALRTEYESKFSRRMSFEDYRRNIEVVSDPALVEKWKEEARTTTTIATREGEPPAVLPSMSEARVHFRQNYFEGLLRTGTAFKVHGSVARNLPEPSMMQAIRQAHDAELRYPAHFVQLLRQGLQNAGLHIFKHRKRVVYVSLSRPSTFAPDGAVSENVAAILATVAKFPLCTRKTLAEQVLARHSGAEGKPAAPEPTPAAALPPTDETTTASEPAAEFSAPAPTAPAVEDPMAKAKAALAADLRFLVQSGHLIEFHNGTFDLPLSSKPREGAASNEPTAEAEDAELDHTPEPVPAMTQEGPADDAERNALTVESVEILPPDAPRESEPAPSLESGLEKTEAQVISEPGPSEQSGVTATEPHGVSSNPVVIGDVESAHPLSPN